MLYLDLKEGDDIYLLDENNQVVGRMVFSAHTHKGTKVGFETTDKITVLRGKLWRMMQIPTGSKREKKLALFKKE